MGEASTLRVQDALRAVPRWWPIAWPQQLRRRLGERSFWLVQAGVLLVTAANWLVQALLDDSAHDSLLGFLVHVPALLYVVPVVYAALRYGLEGGLRTGAWAMLLAVPNAAVHHRHGYAWLGELLLIAVIVGCGAVVASVVERERIHRLRAERATRRATATTQRLEVLSETTSLLVETDRPADELCRVLNRLIDLLDLSAAAVIVTPAVGVAPQLEVACGRADLADRLIEHVPCPQHLPTAAVWQAEDLAAVPLDSDAGEQRALAISGVKLPRLTDRDRELFETVAIQVGAAFRIARLQHERQQRWRRYLQQATRAQEDERRRIARELHDVAVHELLLLNRHLGDVADGVAAADAREQVEEVRQRIGAVTSELRRFSGELRPSVLTHLGLAAALEWLTTQLERRTLVRADVEVDGEVRRLPDEDELALFRVVEEALRNVERHAAATSVVLRLRFRPETVEIDVVDDGTGFDLPASLEDLAGTDRLGLLGMRERAELSGGQLRIDSTPGAGTCLHVAVPDGSRTDGASRGQRVRTCPGPSPSRC